VFPLANGMHVAIVAPDCFLPFTKI